MRNEKAKRVHWWRQRRRKRIIVNENKVVHLYLKGFSVCDIAAQLGFSPSVVHRWLKAFRCISTVQLEYVFQHLDGDRHYYAAYGTATEACGSESE